MRPILAAFLCAWGLTAAAGPASAATFTGLVKSTVGTPVILRAGQSITAAKGVRVEKGDVVKTGPGGAIGIVFSDDTIVSLGPETEVAVDDYLFEPLDKQLSFVARILRGTMSYISGQIAKLSPKSVRLAAPAATIAVRGTHVLISVPE
jgi:hypothetical protein